MLDKIYILVIASLLTLRNGTAYLTRPFSVKTTFVPCFIQLGLGVTIEKKTVAFPSACATFPVVFLQKGSAK